MTFLLLLSPPAICEVSSDFWSFGNSGEQSMNKVWIYERESWNSPHQICPFLVLTIRDLNRAVCKVWQHTPGEWDLHSCTSRTSSWGSSGYFWKLFHFCQGYDKKSTLFWEMVCIWHKSCVNTLRCSRLCSMISNYWQS